MTARILIALAASSLIAANDPKSDLAKREIQKLQGTWVVDSLEQEGRPATAENRRKADGTWIFKDDKVTITSESKGGELTVTIKPEAVPKEIVLTPLDGPRKGKAIQGVYSIVGETLTICLNSNNATEPPPTFATKSGDGRRTLGLKRETPEENAGVLFIFDHADAAKEWRIVNEKDSDGQLRLTDQKTIEFYGSLSSKKDPGFASLRSEPKRLGLEKGDAIVSRVRGDGREYTLNLYPSERASFVARRYQASFQTRQDEWIEVSVPLDKLRWKNLFSSEPARPNENYSLGFVLNDKKAAAFKLEVEWVKVQKSDSEK